MDTIRYCWSEIPMKVDLTSKILRKEDNSDLETIKNILIIALHFPKFQPVSIWVSASICHVMGPGF